MTRNNPRSPLRRSGRLRANALLLAAATASFASAAHGQTWINPNTGNWNVGGNWVGGGVPSSSTSTQLTFNATGVQSYTATNNLGAFTLNRMTFNNSGTGTITVAGQALTFGGGLPGFVQNGSGPATIANTPITLPTTGGTVDTTTISGTGAGTLTLAGNLASSVTPTINNGAVLRLDNPNGRVNLSGGGNLFGLSANQGTVTVTAGQITNFVSASGVNPSAVGTLAVNGSGASINTTELNGGMGAASTGNIVASNGGQILVNNGNAYIASAQDIVGNFLGSSSTTNITGATSSITLNGNGFIDSTGILLFAQGDTGVTSNGTMNISAGGDFTTVVAFIGERNGTATINVSGAGSTFTNTDQLVIESTATSRFNLTSGGVWTSTGEIYTSSNPGDNVAITVSGTNSLANWSASPFATLSGGLAIPAGNTTITINGGGELRANLIYAAADQNGRVDFSVDGTNSRLTIVGAGTLTDNTLVMGDNAGAISTLTVTNGGRTTIGTNGALIMTRNATSTATATFSGAGSLFDASAPGAQLLVAGFGTTHAGPASFTVTSNAIANVNDLTMVYANGRVTIGSGTSPGSLTSGETGVSGTINFNAGTFSTVGTLTVGGQVLLSSAARNAGGTPTNKKTLEVGLLNIVGGGIIDLNDNDAIFHSTPLLTVQTKVRDARNGGAWNASGLTSIAARNAVPKNTSLGVISGAEFHAANGPSATFNGRNVLNSDVLVKYTFYGDTDFNGVVNFDDYARTDNGFNNIRTGWFNGDFDYSGSVNFDDYSLIDLAFNTQGAVVLTITGTDPAGPGERQLIGIDMSGMSPAQGPQAAPMQRLANGVMPIGFAGGIGGNAAGVSAVPEPSVLATATIALAMSLARPRYRRKPRI